MRELWRDAPLYYRCTCAWVHGVARRERIDFPFEGVQHIDRPACRMPRMPTRTVRRGSGKCIFCTSEGRQERIKGRQRDRHHATSSLGPSAMLVSEFAWPFVRTAPFFSRALSSPKCGPASIAYAKACRNERLDDRRRRRTFDGRLIFGPDIRDITIRSAGSGFRDSFFANPRSIAVRHASRCDDDEFEFDRSFPCQTG